MKKLLPIILMLWPYMVVVLGKVENEKLSSLLTGAYILLTIVVYVANIVNAFQCKDPRSLAIFNAVIKIAHIPFFLAIFVLGIGFLFASVVPAMILVTPFLMVILFIVDVLLMLTSSMYGINAIRRAYSAGQISGTFAIVNGILHFFFVADTISAIIVLCKVKKVPSYKW